VYGSTARSISPSRTCKCQSSGRRMVMRLVMEDYSGAGPVITEYAIRQCRRAKAALFAPAGGRAPSGGRE
jgi:hypothetical protein